MEITRYCQRCIEACPGINPEAPDLKIVPEVICEFWAHKELNEAVKAIESAAGVISKYKSDRYVLRTPEEYQDRDFPEDFGK
jgi:hypothetical protein